MKTTPNAAITIRNVWKVFHDRRRKTSVVAMRHVSLTVLPGEFVCIVGPSGCGKSTLLRILAGLDRPTSGEVEVVGLSGRRNPAMVFQEPSLYPWMTVEENVTFPLRIRHVSLADRRARAEPLLEKMGLLDFRTAYPYQLSGGMKQRAAVARALVDESAVLLMDEPFGALDEQTRLALQEELMRVWSGTNKTVVFVTHSVDEALTLSDRVVVMSARPGTIREIVPVPLGRPRDVLELRRQQLYGDLVYHVWQLLGAEGALQKEGR